MVAEECVCDWSDAEAADSAKEIDTAHADATEGLP